MIESMKKIDKKFYWIISSLLAIISILLTFLYKGMLIGDGLILRSDMLAGSMAGIKDVARCILQGENIFFSYNMGMGLNNSLAVASGCLSPFNILYLILFNVDDNIVTLIVTLLKIGCIAGSFQFFLRKVIKCDGFWSIIFSVYYALSAFVIAYGTIHIMWLDAVIILPWLIYAIIRCVEEKKRALLIVLYSYLFISQFYMGYMVGMFSLLFVLCYLLFIRKPKETDKGKVKQFFICFFDWFLSAVIAVMISAVIWAPVLYFILANRAEDSTEIFEIRANLLQIINSLFWGEGYGIEGTYAYIYSGIFSLFLLPFYFINKEIEKKEKVFSAILLGFMFLCTIWVPLNSFMHVFDQPDSFWYRYSFIISFCICTLACRQIKMMKEIKGKLFWIVLGGLILFYQLQQQMNLLATLDTAANPSQNSTIGFIVNFVILIAWIVFFNLYQKHESKRIIWASLCIILVAGEVSTSGIFEIPVVEKKDTYYEWYETTQNAIEDIKKNDNGLYRTICTNSISTNTDTWFGYNGISDFGDVEKYSVRNFLSNIGFATSTRWVNETGYNPVSNMLLGIKYNIMNKSLQMEYEEDENVNELSYITNDQILGFGYMVDGDIVLYEYSGRNVFENMNEIVNSMSGLDKDCFVKVQDENIKFDAFGCTYSGKREDELQYITLDESNGSLFITVTDDEYDEYYLQIETNEVGYFIYDFYVMGAQNLGATEYISAQFSNANKFYYNEEKNKYTLRIYAEENSSPKSIEFNALNIYGVDKNALAEQYEELAKQQLQVTKWSNGHIEGTVNVIDDKRLMFVSIPYDPGWNLKIDGKETEIVRLIDGAFIGFFLPSDGEHTIELDYEVPGLKVGFAITLCGLLAFLSVVFEKQIKALKKNENNKSKAN